MKKAMSPKALAKEEARWKALKQTAKLNPGSICRK